MRAKTERTARTGEQRNIQALTLEKSETENLRRKNAVVDIRSFKSLISQNFPRNSSIYEVVMSDSDFLVPEDFVSKLSIWLKLCRRIRD